MAYSKELLIAVAMTDYSVHFVIAKNISGNENHPEKIRIKKELEAEYDKLGKDKFRHENGITPTKIQNYLCNKQS